MNLFLKKTDCICYGVENSKKTVEYLNQNKKSNNVSFIYDDMDNEVWNAPEYEIVLAVDSLYFVHDLEKTISNLFRLIKNKGIAIIYYTEYGFNSENENWKDAKTNKLGKVPESKNIKYEYLDITEREAGQWKKMLQIEQEFNEKFESEGNKLMFDITIDEAKCCWNNMQSPEEKDLNIFIIGSEVGSLI